MKAPHRVVFFAWEGGRKCILTIDKLKRRRILVNWCCLCKRAEETCNYILLGCLVAYNLWSMAYGIIGYQWVMVGTIRDDFMGVLRID